MSRKLLQKICLAASVLFVSGCGIKTKPNQEVGVFPNDEETVSVNKAGNNIAVSYIKDRKNYLNISGTISGPYETPTLGGSPTTLTYISESIISIRYAKKGKQFVDINDITYGPYEDLLNMEVNGSQWGFIFIDNGMYYNINGEAFGPYDYYPDSIVFSENNYGFHYQKNGKDFIKTKKETHGPYDYAGITFINDKHESFSYQLNNKWHTYLDGAIYDGGEIEIKASKKYTMQYTHLENKEIIAVDGKEYGPYDYIYNYNVGENVWAFAYIDKEKAYIQTHNQKYGPFPTREYEGRLYGVADFSLGDNLIAITSPADNGLTSIMINNKEQGPHNTIYSVSFNKNNWYYNFKIDDKNYVNNNGKIYPTNADYAVVEYSGDNWAYVDRGENEQMFMVNGTQYGPFDLSTQLALLKSKWAEINKVDKDYQITFHSL